MIDTKTGGGRDEREEGAAADRKRRARGVFRRQQRERTDVHAGLAELLEALGVVDLGADGGNDGRLAGEAVLVPHGVEPGRRGGSDGSIGISAREAR